MQSSLPHQLLADPSHCPLPWFFSHHHNLLPNASLKKVELHSFTLLLLSDLNNTHIEATAREPHPARSRTHRTLELSAFYCCQLPQLDAEICPMQPSHHLARVADELYH